MFRTVSIFEKKMFRRWMCASVNSKPLLKLLLPNHVVPRLIGDHGAVINELRAKTSGDILVSVKNTFYPGTEERIVTITGELYEINEINNFIIDRMDHSTNTSRIILTNNTVRHLITHGDLPIQDYQSVNSSLKRGKFRCSLETSTVSGEHLLNISGSKKLRFGVCRKVIEMVSEDPQYMQNTSLDYGCEEGNESDSIKETVFVKMEIPNFLFGAIIGIEGQNMTDICNESGAQLYLSNKGVFVPGTTNGILRIEGDMEQCRLAHNLVRQKLQEWFELNQN